MKKFNEIARPYLTALIATLFNIALIWALWMRLLDVKDYINAVGPTNAMIIGFWFGEKAALTDPKRHSGKEVAGQQEASQ